jgi:ATP sulfurylase
VSFFEVTKVNRKIRNIVTTGNKPKEVAARKEMETIIKSVAQEAVQKAKYEKKLQKAVEEQKAQQGEDDDLNA